MARLLIVDDRHTVGELLARALKLAGHEVVGHFWKADQVLAAAETGHDVVLMKLDLPRDTNSSPLAGFPLTEALLQRDPTERVLLYTEVEGLEYVDRAREAGAAGYLSKPEWLYELQEAIESVASGGESWPA